MEKKGECSDPSLGNDILETLLSITDLREIIMKGLHCCFRNDAPDIAIAMNSSSFCRWNQTSLKEDLLPSRGDFFVQCQARNCCCLCFTKLFSNFFGVLTSLSQSEYSFFFIGFLMAKYGSNDEYSFLGGLQAAAQAISHKISLTLCLLSISQPVIQIT